MKRLIPNWQERQKILYSRDRKGDPTILKELGQNCLEEGRFQEALEYLLEAKDDIGIKKLEKNVIEEGDSFLLFQIEKYTNQQRPTETWNQLGMHAMDQKKYAYALKAFEKINHEIMLAKIRSLLGNENGNIPPIDPAA